MGRVRAPRRACPGRPTRAPGSASPAPASVPRRIRASSNDVASSRCRSADTTRILHADRGQLDAVVRQLLVPVLLGVVEQRLRGLAPDVRRLAVDVQRERVGLRRGRTARRRPGSRARHGRPSRRRTARGCASMIRLRPSPGCTLTCRCRPTTCPSRRSADPAGTRSGRPSPAWCRRSRSCTGRSSGTCRTRRTMRLPGDVVVVVAGGDRVGADDAEAVERPASASPSAPSLQHGRRRRRSTVMSSPKKPPAETPPSVRSGTGTGSSWPAYASSGIDDVDPRRRRCCRRAPARPLRRPCRTAAPSTVPSSGGPGGAVGRRLEVEVVVALLDVVAALERQRRRRLARSGRPSWSACCRRSSALPEKYCFVARERRAEVGGDLACRAAPRPRPAALAVLYSCGPRFERRLLPGRPRSRSRASRAAACSTRRGRPARVPMPARPLAPSRLCAISVQYSLLLSPPLRMS